MKTGPLVVRQAHHYQEITRRGAGRVFDGTGMTSRVFRYQLPNEWTLVP